MLLNYKGLWDATTNVPALVDGTGIAGDTYMIMVDGGLFITNRDLGSGTRSWAAYSYISYDGSIWKSSLTFT